MTANAGCARSSPRRDTHRPLSSSTRAPVRDMNGHTVRGLPRLRGADHPRRVRALRPASRMVARAPAARSDQRAKEGDMASASTQPLAADELVKLLSLVKEADSVELKLTVPDPQRRSAVSALEMDPLDGQI